MTKCDKCGKDAITLIRYSGIHLCAKHFTQFVEDRVKKEIRKQCDLTKDDNIAVALSGGKDSSITLYLIHKILSDRKYLKISAITVDEGIQGYRKNTIDASKRLCRKLGVEQNIVTFKKEIGYTLDELAIMDWKDNEFASCTYCGVFRRYCLNKKAKELGATRLATGLNLDDTVQSVMMNICRGDIDKLARMGPHFHTQNGLISRIQPLRLIPEKESYLYAYLNGIEFDHSECPYSNLALRNTYRDVIGVLEGRTPGTRHSIIVSSDKIVRQYLDRNGSFALETCTQCGEPTGQKQCKTCALINQIRKMKSIS